MREHMYRQRLQNGNVEKLEKSFAWVCSLIVCNKPLGLIACVLWNSSGTMIEPSFMILQYIACVTKDFITSTKNF